MILAKDRLDKFYHGTWWLLAVTIPWAIAFNNLFLILLILVWLAEGSFYEKWLTLKRSPWIFPFILLFFMYGVGLLYSNNLTSGVDDLVRKIPILVLPLIAATGPILQPSFIDRIKRSFAYSCFLVVVISLCMAVFGLYSEGPSTENLGVAENQYRSLHSTASLIWLHFSYIQAGRWGDLHPSYFSMFLLFSIIVLLNNEESSRKYSILRIAVVVVMIIFIALLSSRMAILTFIATSLYWIIKDTKTRMVKGIIQFSLAVLILVFLVWLNPVARFRIIEEPLHTPIAVNKNTTEWNSLSYRLLEWNGAWSTISQNPIFGVGTGDGNQALKSFYTTYNSSTASVEYNAHNQYFQTWIEIGLPGLIFLVLCLMMSLMKFPLKSIDISFTIIFTMMCSAESMLERQKGIIFFSLFSALLLCTKKSDQ